MVGLGETDEEVMDVMRDLRAHEVDGITIGQYLQPSKHHAPVQTVRGARAVRTSSRSSRSRNSASCSIASGPLVRSSYHADLQHQGVDVGKRNPSACPRDTLRSGQQQERPESTRRSWSTHDKDVPMA
jgi:lipoic acid synthetase